MCGSCAWKYIATCICDHVTFRCILCRTEVTEYKGDITVVMDEFKMEQLVSITKTQHPVKRITATLNFEPCSM